MDINREYTNDEKDLITIFDNRAKERVAVVLSNNGKLESCNYYSILLECNPSNDIFNKDGLLNQTLWLKYLTHVQAYIPSSYYKYQSIDAFLKAYPSKFDYHDDDEIECLRRTANLMVLLLTMVTPRKNKGLAMAVIPKVVEGINAKYVTGSGQTKATADRVHIFETEGGISAFRRGGRSKTASKQKFQAIVDNVPLPASKKANVGSSSSINNNNNNNNNNTTTIQERKEHHSPIQKFLFIDQPFEVSSTYNISYNGFNFDEKDTTSRFQSSSSSSSSSSSDKNSNIFNSFMSGYNDDEFFECLTSIQEVPKANAKKLESKSFISIQSSTNSTTTDKEMNDAKEREHFASIIKSHDELSKLFTWGPSALLQPIAESVVPLKSSSSSSSSSQPFKNGSIKSGQVPSFSSSSFSSSSILPEPSFFKY